MAENCSWALCLCVEELELQSSAFLEALGGVNAGLAKKPSNSLGKQWTVWCVFSLSSANVCYGEMAKWGNAWKHFLNSHLPLNWQFKNWVRRAKNCSKVLLEFGIDFGARISSSICSTLPTTVINCRKSWPVKILYWRLRVPSQLFFSHLLFKFLVLEIHWGSVLAKSSELLLLWFPVLVPYLNRWSLTVLSMAIGVWRSEILMDRPCNGKNWISVNPVSIRRQFYS